MIRGFLFPATRRFGLQPRSQNTLDVDALSRRCLSPRETVAMMEEEVGRVSHSRGRKQTGANSTKSSGERGAASLFTGSPQRDEASF